METVRGKAGSSQVQRKRWKDFHKDSTIKSEYLKVLPETSEEDYVTEEDLLKVISYYYAKCRDLLEKEFEVPEGLELVKYYFKMEKELSETSSLREVVCAIEIILFEYEVHVGDLVRKHTERNADSDKSIEPKGFKTLLDSTPEDQCLEVLVKKYFKVGVKLQDIKGESGNMSSGKTGKMRKASKKKSSAEKSSSTKGSPSHKMEFLKDLMTIIGAAMTLHEMPRSKN